MTWTFPKPVGNSGTVTSVTAADTSLVAGGTAAAVTLQTNTLDVIAADHPAAADWSNNSHKITALANGTAATDALAVGQVLAAGAIPIADLVDPTTGKFIGSSGGAATAIFPPGHEFDRVAITGNISVTHTSEGSADTVIAGNAVVWDGSTEVVVEAWCPSVIKGTNNITMVLLSGATVIGQSEQDGTSQAPVYLRRIFTPAAATTAFTWKAFVDAGTGTVQCGSGASGTRMPAVLRITKS